MKILWWYLSIRILYSSYYFPFFQPSYHPYVFLFFFLFLLHTLSFLIPIPLLLSYPCPLSFLSSSSFRWSSKLSFSLFSPTFSLSFFFFFTWLQCSHSHSFFFFSTLSLSLCFFFFFLDSRMGYYGKTALRQFSPLAFPPDLGGKNLWTRERNFSPGFFTPPIFLPLPNRGKPTFLPHFPHLLKSIQPNTMLCLCETLTW